MVKAFRELGHEVEMVALVELEGAGGKKTRGGGWGWLARWVPNWLYELMSLTYNLYGYRRLCRAVREKSPDLIYERYSLNTFCGIWAGRRFGIPMVLEVNAPLCQEQSRLGKLAFGRLARFSERWICSNSTKTITVTQVMKDLLAQEGVPETHVVVMPNGIDPGHFNPEVSGEAVRKRYNLQGHVVVGFVGWFRKWHGLEMLLEIVHEADLAGRGVRLLLVGDGPAFADLSRYVDTHGLGSSVIFTGPVGRAEIAAHIAAMDITVQPSVTDYACPMKIIEYMGMGKCVVAPDQPNIREILEDGVTGLLFRGRDKSSLHAALGKLVGDPVQCKALGSNAREQIFGRGFLWKANAERVLSLVFGEPQEASPNSTMNQATPAVVSSTAAMHHATERPVASDAKLVGIPEIRLRQD
jgi:glycosyltransferase involved in cell wall biosynthesis